jgi:hypothetical protein
MEQLSIEDINFILESLKYTRLKFENNPIGPQGYPTYEFKRERLDQVEKVMGHVSEYKSFLIKKGK